MISGNMEAVEVALRNCTQDELREFAGAVLFSQDIRRIENEFEIAESGTPAYTDEEDILVKAILGYFE